MVSISQVELNCLVNNLIVLEELMITMVDSGSMTEAAAQQLQVRHKAMYEIVELVVGKPVR